MESNRHQITIYPDYFVKNPMFLVLSSNAQFHFTLQRLMTSFIGRIFTAKSFESDFPLVLDVDGQKGKNIKVPDGIR